MKRVVSVFIMAAVLLCGLATAAAAADLAPGLQYKDPFTIVGQKNFYKGYAPLNGDGTINAVVAIPTGTNAKWEVNEKDGTLVWDKRDNKPRVIQYLGYLGNFGIVPQSIGEDKEVLAILVIGEPAARGAVLKAKVIGAIKLVNTRGVETDKIIAVSESSPLYAVNSLAELNKSYPGVTTIIETWFINYNGIGKMKSLGFLDADEAKSIVNSAVLDYMAKK